jgi:hypothetical protein
MKRKERAQPEQQKEKNLRPGAMTGLIFIFYLRAASLSLSDDCFLTRRKKNEKSAENLRLLIGGNSPEWPPNDFFADLGSCY